MMNEQLSHASLNTPIGKLHLYTSPKGLQVVCEEKCHNHFKKKYSLKENNKNSKELALAKKQIKQYFSGDVDALNSLPLAPEGTPFQKKVWKALSRIKPGKTLSYGEVAKKVGSPNASRAVGAACRENPILLAVPCHRVISSKGELTGFRAGLQRKKYLLNHEA